LVTRGVINVNKIIKTFPTWKSGCHSRHGILQQQAHLSLSMKNPNKEFLRGVKNKEKSRKK
jgi:hypothetical protein